MRIPEILTHKEIETSLRALLAEIDRNIVECQRGFEMCGGPLDREPNDMGELWRQSRGELVAAWASMKDKLLMQFPFLSE